MSNDPDVIRAQIEATREGLSADVNELGDKVSPTQIAKRQGERIKGAATSVKDRVLGSAENAAQSAGGAVATVSDAVSDAPGMVARRTQGSPVAAGLIAFGAGMLLASLFPASRAEAQAAAAVKDQAQPSDRRSHVHRERDCRQPPGTGTAGPGIGQIHRLRCRRHRQGRSGGIGRRGQESGPGRQGHHRRTRRRGITTAHSRGLHCVLPEIRPDG